MLRYNMQTFGYLNMVPKHRASTVWIENEMYASETAYSVSVILQDLKQVLNFVIAIVIRVART